MAASQTPDLKALDAARQRLWTLSNALQTLKNELQYRESLPPWPTLQDATTLTNHQLQALATHLASPQNAPLLSAAHAYPTPSFPDNGHQNVAEQLLRKKAEPALDAWSASGRAAGVAASSASSTNPPTTNPPTTNIPSDNANTNPAENASTPETLRALWSWAASDAIASAGHVPWGTDFTVAERAAGIASVRHGLARELDDGEGGESDEDDDEDDEDEDEDAMAVDAPAPPVPSAASASTASVGAHGRGLAAPALAVEDLLRFASAGTVSPALAARGGIANAA